MAVTSISRRVVRIPNLQVGKAQQVRAEVMAQMNSLKLAGTNVLVTFSDPNLSLAEAPLIQLECSLVAANDTTLVGLFAGWATLLGVTLIDTEVYPTINSGY